MARQRPKAYYTREEWAQVPPVLRLEAGDRLFTYVVRQVARRDGWAQHEERILYEVELVDTPVPGFGLPPEG